MKSSLGKMLPILYAAALMGGGLPAVQEPEPKQQRRKLGSYKHTGEIPKGCKLETHTIFDVEVDVVFGSEKAKAKKLKKYEI